MSSYLHTKGMPAKRKEKQKFVRSGERMEIGSIIRSDLKEHLKGCPEGDN